MSKSPPRRTDDAVADEADTLEHRVLSAAAGSLAALVVAAALVPWRAEIVNANVALVLFAVVVAAGSYGGTTAAVCTALVAGLAFNAFHTVPYGSLKIDDGADQLTLALLVLGGLVVGSLAARRSGVLAEARRAQRDLDRLEAFAAVSSDGEPARNLLVRLRDEVRRSLGAIDVWIEDAGAYTASAALPVLDRRGVRGETRRRWAGTGFALPTAGVQLPMRAGGIAGRVVVRPDPNRAVDRAARDYVLAVVAVAALALATQPDDARRALALGDGGPDDGRGGLTA